LDRNKCFENSKKCEFSGEKLFLVWSKKFGPVQNDLDLQKEKAMSMAYYNPIDNLLS
jgi:hypothetical protein